MAEILIRKAGPAIQVAARDGGPTPQNVRRVVETPLYYEFREMQLGGIAYATTTGAYQPIQVEYRRVYVYDSNDRLCCPKGYAATIIERLKAAGHTVFWEDLDPPKDPAIYTPNWERVVSAFNFRPRQDDCLVAIASNDSGVIDAVPAFGKMWIIAMICAMYPKAKIDIVTKRRPIVNSIVNLLIPYVPNVGKVCTGRKTKDRVTVYTLDSLHHSDYDADILLIDEVHEAVTDRYSTAISRYWYSRNYGFTATLNTRADGLQHRIMGFCGSTIFKLGQEEAERLKLVTPVVVYWLPIEMDHNPAADAGTTVQRKQRGIWTNDYRNRKIAEAARGYYRQGMQVLIAVDTVEHALHLRRFLPEFEICHSEQALNNPQRREVLEMSGVLDDSLPEMTSARREDMQARFTSGELQGAIATSVWRVGVSFDNLQVLMRVDGGRSETESVQTVGRVMRRAEGKDYGIVIDCHDKWDKGFRDATMTRRRSYAARGWQQYTADGKPWNPRQTRGG